MQTPHLRKLEFLRCLSGLGKDLVLPQGPMGGLCLGPKPDIPSKNAMLWASVLYRALITLSLKTLSFQVTGAYGVGGFRSWLLHEIYICNRASATGEEPL